jgi:hypothetical protein
VLRRTDQGGGYVAPAGSKKAYARTKAGARRFLSRDAALADACGNEIPERL